MHFSWPEVYDESHDYTWESLMALARLLEKVIYTPRQFESKLDDLGVEYIVSSTYPTNPESKSAKKNAEQWAENNHRRKIGFVPSAFVRENKPFDVTIIELEHRGQGGRAYKVVDDDGFMFDFREDQLMECILRYGVSKGGKLNAKVVWGVTGSQVRLAVVGSKLHDEMKKGLSYRKEGKKLAEKGEHITPGKMKPGHIYRRGNDFALFLGRTRMVNANSPHFCFLKLPDILSPPKWRHPHFDKEKHPNFYDDYTNTQKFEAIIEYEFGYSGLENRRLYGYDYIKSTKAYHADVHELTKEQLEYFRSRFVNGRVTHPEIRRLSQTEPKRPDHWSEGPWKYIHPGETYKRVDDKILQKHVDAWAIEHAKWVKDYSVAVNAIEGVWL